MALLNKRAMLDSPISGGVLQVKENLCFMWLRNNVVRQFLILQVIKLLMLASMNKFLHNLEVDLKLLKRLSIDKVVMIMHTFNNTHKHNISSDIS